MKLENIYGNYKLVYDKKMNPVLSDGYNIAFVKHVIEEVAISENANWICKILDAITNRGSDGYYYYHMYRGGKENIDEFIEYHTTDYERGMIDKIIKELSEANSLGIPYYISGVEIIRL